MAIKLEHSLKYEALYKQVDSFYRTVGFSDGVESIFEDAMRKLRHFCKVTTPMVKLRPPMRSRVIF